MKIKRVFLEMVCIVVNIIAILPSIAYGKQSKVKRLPGQGFLEAPEELCENGTTPLLHSRVCVDSNYEEADLPPNQDPIPIYYKVTEMDILDINEKGKTIKIEMGLGRGWQDDRIEVHSLSNEPPWVGFYYKILPIWFPTEKRRHARNMEEEQEETIIGQNDSEGAWVLTYSEIYLDIHCDFKFAKFPMDTQYCPFIFTNENSGNLQLLPLANDTLGELQPLLSLDKEKDSFPHLEKDGFEITTLFVHGNTLRDQDLSYWGFNLTMRRITSTYVYQYYVPGAAIVCVSHISFIIPHHSIPGRIGLLATLFLTLMNIFINHMVSIINKIAQLIFLYNR